MWRCILVHLDATQPAQRPALLEALRLARASGARLVVVDVADELPGYARRLLPSSSRLLELARAERLDRLRAAARPALRAGVPTALRVLDGSPAGAMLREATREGAELVVLHPGAGTGGATGAALGAPAARVLRKAEADVLLVRGPLGRRPRVLAAVDVGHEAASGTLTGVVLEQAGEVTRLLAGRLAVIHAWTCLGETTMRGLGGLPAEKVREYVQATRAEAAAALRAAVAGTLPLDPSQLHLVKGDPRRVIAAAARALRATLLVIGSVARSGVAGAVIGNTAEALAARLPCSMLVVKPRAGRVAAP